MISEIPFAHSLLQLCTLRWSQKNCRTEQNVPETLETSLPYLSDFLLHPLPPQKSYTSKP